MSVTFPKLLANTFLDGLQFVHILVFIAGGIGFLLFWKRAGYWLPRYIHVFGAIALAVGIWATWSMPMDAPGRRQPLLIRCAIALVLPAMVYAFFILHGGQRSAYRRRGNQTVPCAVCGKEIRVVEGKQATLGAFSCPHCGHIASRT